MSPLLTPGERLDVPARRGVVEEYNDEFPNRRLQSGAEFEWPNAPSHDGGDIDLATDIPCQNAEIHDLAYAIDLTEGWYALTTPVLDLGFALRFPIDPFESLWYWQPFGGYTPSHRFGIEPTTSASNRRRRTRATPTVGVRPAR
ncbi:hypothetical protein [Haloprofundus salilacus]|uniref:hypothetical protein n=1 Tax=Haloprofundus salilacus TaxID=2876190 RepID=UPI001CCDA87A|nr:hypothetical protein [Haloprofundus salilacus]